MKREAEIKELLINNVIRLVAEGGFEKATTKAITYSGETLSDIKLNEVYIYRLFENKEHLYERTFEFLDAKLLFAFKDAVGEIDEIGTEIKNKLNKVFLKVWCFVLENETVCRCYVRYYYSVYFRGRSLEVHNKHFESVIEAFLPLFKKEADVKAIMHCVFTTLLDFAIRVYNGELENNSINASNIFNVIYCVMSSYFREGISVVETKP